MIDDNADDNAQHHKYIDIKLFEIFNDNLTLQTFQEVASNFLKESISIKGQFCSFMSQNRFRKVTACRIHLFKKGLRKKILRISYESQ